MQLLGVEFIYCKETIGMEIKAISYNLTGMYTAVLDRDQIYYDVLRASYDLIT